MTVEEPGHPLAELTPERSWKVRNHSPDGFNYGYSGSGPAQLALAILIDFTGDAHEYGLAADRYHPFKFRFLSRMRQDEPFEIHGVAIRAWLEQQERAKPFSAVLDGDA